MQAHMYELGRLSSIPPYSSIEYKLVVSMALVAMLVAFKPAANSRDTMFRGGGTSWAM